LTGISVWRTEGAERIEGSSIPSAPSVLCYKITYFEFYLMPPTYASTVALLYLQPR
jgi:hypothetical protein